MKYNYSEISGKYRTFVPNMETKIETTNTGGKVLAYDGDELVGRLEFSDAECKICKYKSLIISVYTSNCRGDRYYADGRRRDGKYTNICKDVFPVLCIFTFVNTCFYRFLHSLKMV